MGNSIPNVLLVEDSVDVLRLVETALRDGVRVVGRDSVDTALAYLEHETPDLVLLDVGLPDGDGFQLCSMLQHDPHTKNIPIVFLTARGDAKDRILAFTLGADDFIEKPFDPRELRVRVESRLRKAAASPPALQYGALRIDPARYRASRVEGDLECDLCLTPNEFRILHTLARHEDQVLSREQLRQAVWGDVVVTPRTVDAHMSNLRRKLQAEARWIESVRGLGYRFRTWVASPEG